MQRWAMTTALAPAVASAAAAQQAADAVDPEIAVDLPAAFDGLSDAAAAAWATRAQGRPVEAGRWMVAAQNPLAAEAGARVLRAGGTAADAMVAVQAVLGLVEPQSSGLGGGVMSRRWWKFEVGVISGCTATTQPAAGTAREITP